MKFLILNGADKNYGKVDLICNVFSNACEANGHDVNLMTLRDMEIADCRGEYNCWLKTPGICMLTDEGRIIPELFAKSHTVIMVTPITYGGHSYHLKKALDRCNPNEMPFAKIHSGEVRYSIRYERPLNYIIVGTMPEENAEKEKTFKKLIERNAISLNASIYLGSVILDNQPSDLIRKEVDRLLRKVGGMK